MGAGAENKRLIKRGTDQISGCEGKERRGEGKQEGRESKMRRSEKKKNNDLMDER